MSLKVTEQEKEFAGKAAQYQREMKHLQRLLEDKQETLDEVLQQKRQVSQSLKYTRLICLVKRRQAQARSLSKSPFCFALAGLSFLDQKNQSLLSADSVHSPSAQLPSPLHLACKYLKEVIDCEC